MNAHQRYLESPTAEDDDSALEAESRVLEEMAESPDCFDHWLSGRPCPMSVASLLSAILSNPSLSIAGRAVRHDFEEWARTNDPAIPFAESPVEAWIKQGMTY